MKQKQTEKPIKAIKPLSGKLTLYCIRSWIRGLPPLYVSICAALFIELRSYINFCNICSSLLYLGGVTSFVCATILAHILSTRADAYRQAYYREFDKYIDGSRKREPNPKHICGRGENEHKTKDNKKSRLRKQCLHQFQYYGVFLFGIVGSILLIVNHLHFGDQSCNHNVILQCQIDSLKKINSQQALQVIESKQINDSIIELCFDLTAKQNN